MSKFIPDAPLTDEKTNAKLLNFIKMANTLKNQVEHTSFFKNWDWWHISNANTFIQEVLDETKKEHNKDVKQKNEGEDLNKMISDLFYQIHGLLSLTA